MAIVNRTLLIWATCILTTACSKSESSNSTGNPTPPPGGGTATNIKADFSFTVQGSKIIITDKSVNRDMSRYTFYNPTLNRTDYNLLSKTDNQTFTFNTPCGFNVQAKLVVTRGNAPNQVYMDSITKSISVAPYSTKIVETWVYKPAPGNPPYVYEKRADSASIYLYHTYADMVNMVNPVAGPFVTDKAGQYSIVNFQPIGEYYLRATWKGLTSKPSNVPLKFTGADCHFHEEHIDFFRP